MHAEHRLGARWIRNGLHGDSAQMGRFCALRSAGGTGVRHRGTHKCRHCQEGVQIWPGDYIPLSGLRWVFFWIFLAGALVFSPRGSSQSWSARSGEDERA